MGIGKYKYYFRKPKSEITKDLLLLLAVSGMIVVAATSPHLGTNLVRAYQRRKKYTPRRDEKRDCINAFYRLLRDGSITVERSTKQIYISLTERGRAKAGWLQINHLRIEKPKKWDGIWRIVIFDIAHQHRLKREALRGLLKRLDFYQLQKSVWIHPYNCKSEVELLADFFGLTSKEIRLIESGAIGKDTEIKKYFHM